MAKTRHFELGSLKMVWYSVLTASSSAALSRWFAEKRGAVCQMKDRSRPNGERDKKTT